eukprot:1327019-Rhodomonas_salina.1
MLKERAESGSRSRDCHPAAPGKRRVGGSIICLVSTGNHIACLSHRHAGDLDHAPRKGVRKITCPTQFVPGKRLPGSSLLAGGFRMRRLLAERSSARSRLLHLSTSTSSLRIIAASGETKQNSISRPAARAKESRDDVVYLDQHHDHRDRYHAINRSIRHGCVSMVKCCAVCGSLIKNHDVGTSRRGAQIADVGTK